MCGARYSNYIENEEMKPHILISNLPVTKRFSHTPADDTDEDLFPQKNFVWAMKCLFRWLKIDFCWSLFVYNKQLKLNWTFGAPCLI